MSEIPEVSFIMPAFNVEAYIGRAIESIQRQDFTNWELIVVDDCSTDNTVEVVEKIAAAEPRIRLIKRDENSGGAILPRKQAVEAAKSVLIAPLDAGDWIEPRYASKLLELKKRTGAQVVFPTMWRVSDFDSEPTKMLPLDKFTMDEAYVGRDLVKSTLNGWKIGCNGGILDKDLYLKCFNEVEDYTNAFIDEYKARIILEHASVVALSSAKYFYFLSDESVTRQISMRRFDILKVNLILCDFIYKNYGDFSEERQLIEQQKFETLIESLNLFVSHEKQFDKNQRADLKDMFANYYKSINWQVIKPYAGKKYYYLMRMGLEPAYHFLKIHGRLFKK